MPYQVRIDHDLRLLVVTLRGDMTEAEVLEYQQEAAWTQPELLGYSELVDLTRVSEFTFGIARYLPMFADWSARRDPPGDLAGCLLIVAADDFHFGLGRMYQAHRELHPHSQRKVGVFRSMDEALTWLAAQRTAKKVEPPAEQHGGC
jgi:hypothetical protein